MHPNVIYAIFKRNFNAYFASPIGYVFICAFVLLGAFAAFWPSEFFNANLANLDQLNQHLPWIMLVFIPAITMGIWAEERRQGTDELLLTLPATDFDVVIGKYKAALLIFTVALAFSMSNVFVLEYLGNPDWGLLAANVLGYWLVGAAMLAVGMVASFLTNNLTVGFILAIAFNAPLVFAFWAGSIVPDEQVARFLKSLSVSEQFYDFGRGVISLSSIVFFVSVIVVMLYISMALIGRRHWMHNPGSRGMGWHYLLRTAALIAIAVGVNVLAARFDMHADASAERLNSLSDKTVSILKSLPGDRPVYIEAYISPEVPEDYVPVRLNLISTLREFSSIGGDRVILRITETERFSPEAATAQEQFGITARPVDSLVDGRYSVNEIFLGVAVLGGLDKVVVPFFDLGMPVEIELLRAVATVSQQQRKKIGVVTTDAELFGGFDFESFRARPPQQIIVELQKQYDVEQVSTAQPIDSKYDVLLVPQPSSLPQEQLDHVIAAIKTGQPTVIFEDPLPNFFPRVPATSQPRMPPGGNNPFNRQPPPEPKGDINLLWSMLGIHIPASEIVWQLYNPYPKIGNLPPEFVFVSSNFAGELAINDDVEAVSGLGDVLMMFPGNITRRAEATTTLTPLLRAAIKTGSLQYGQILERDMFGRANINPNRRYAMTGEPYTLAALVSGKPSSIDPSEAGTDSSVNVAIVADMDVMSSAFFEIRNQAARRDAELQVQLDNITFVLNLLDHMAGDDRFIEVRKRRPEHRTLAKMEETLEPIRSEASKQRDEFAARYEEQRAEQQRRFQDTIDKLNERKDLDVQTLLQQVAIKQQSEQRKLDAELEKLDREREQAEEKLEIQMASEIRRVQNNYKFAAIALPPIPPLLVGIIIFFRRRSQERVGIPKSRLR